MLLCYTPFALTQLTIRLMQHSVSFSRYPNKIAFHDLRRKRISRSSTKLICELIPYKCVRISYKSDQQSWFAFHDTRPSTILSSHLNQWLITFNNTSMHYTLICINCLRMSKAKTINVLKIIIKKKFPSIPKNLITSFFNKKSHFFM